jgi:hypothetical protein
VSKAREPIGDIKCPLCARPAELHRFEPKEKLNPDGDVPKAAYAKKCFVICPPTTGYRGCGTILANGPQAQERMMELGRVFGPSGKAAAKPSTPAEPAPPPPSAPAAAPAAKPAAPHNPFRLW